MRYPVRLLLLGFLVTVIGSTLGNAVAQANDHPPQHIARQQAPVALGVVILPSDLCNATSEAGATTGAAVGWVRPGGGR